MGFRGAGVTLALAAKGRLPLLLRSVQICRGGAEAGSATAERPPAWKWEAQRQASFRPRRAGRLRNLELLSKQEQPGGEAAPSSNSCLGTGETPLDVQPRCCL